jgi:hypothetical protein
MKKLVAASLLCTYFLAPTTSTAAPEPAADDHLGKVEFQTSCVVSVQPIIDKGAALLHSFQYLQSEHTFADAVKQDPKCAMAHWGRAMALYHQLWDFPEQKTLDAGRKEIDAAKKLKNGSPREKQFIATAEVFFQKRKLDREARVAAAYARAAAICVCIACHAWATSFWNSS